MNRRGVLLATLLAAIAAIPLWLVARAPTDLDVVSRAHLEEPAHPVLEADTRPTLAGRGAGSAPGPKPSVPTGKTSEPGAVPDSGISRVSLRLETVDYQTGMPLETLWAVSTQPGSDERALLVLLEIVGDSRFDGLEGTLTRSGAACPDAFREQHVGEARLLIRRPRGYARFEARPHVTFQHAAGVRETWALAPLAREAVLELRILGLDGRPDGGARVQALEVAGQKRPVQTEPIGNGELRLRGIPFLPGEPVKVAMEWDPDAKPKPVDEIAEETEETEVVGGLVDPDLTTTIPSDLTRPWSAVVRRRPPSPDPLQVTTDKDMPYEESLAESETLAGPTLPTAHLRVRAFDWEGRPLAGAAIGGVPTDDTGTVLIGAVRGPYAVWLNEPGRFPVLGRAELSEGKVTELVLREPQGTRLEVLVTDAEGNPRPCARLTVSGTVFDVVEGVQRVDMFTDHRGRRTLERVEPGQRTVRATWGSRSGSQEVVLPDGETVRLTIVAK